MLLEITPEGNEYLDEVLNKMLDYPYIEEDKRLSKSKKDRYIQETIILLYFKRRPETAEDVIAENRRKLPNSDADWKGIIRGFFESGYIEPVGSVQEESL